MGGVSVPFSAATEAAENSSPEIPTPGVGVAVLHGLLDWPILREIRVAWSGAIDDPDWV
jgi:hypothetical protein